MDMNLGKIELSGNYLLTLDQYYLEPCNLGVHFNYHPELEISLAKSGSGIYVVDDRKYDIREGDIFIFNNIEPHSITTVDSPNCLINSVIMFDPRFIWSIESNVFDSRYLKVFFDRNDHFQNRLDRNNPAAEEIRKLFLEIEQEFSGKLPEYELMAKVKLMNILVSLIRYFGYTGNNSSDNSKHRCNLNRINKTMDYINTNLSNELRLEELAAIAYMNPSYFSTFFKKYIGLSPLEYVAKKRVSRAVEYLKNTDRNILDIALICGFNNSASFNKVFKKYVGKVPSDFRK